MENKQDEAEYIALGIRDNTVEVLLGKNLEVNLIYFNGNLENLAIAIYNEQAKGNSTTFLEKIHAKCLLAKVEILRQLDLY